MKLDITNLNYSVDFKAYEKKLREVDKNLNNKTCLGSDFLGWLDYPLNYDKEELVSIIDSAEYVRQNYDCLVVCGIGGSYLGARAGIEAINGIRNIKKPEIIFMGQTLSSDYINETLEYLKNKNFAINVISKSGTTTETAICFRLLKELLIKKVGKENARKAIFATTDIKQGALREMAVNEGYKTFTLKSDIGGRFSVLTAVGLFPMAVAGIDVTKVLDGAMKAMQDTRNSDLNKNDAYKYAVIRDRMYRLGYKSEMFVMYEPKLIQFGEWLKQLFGESEGKENKGLLPVSSTFTTDLHSLGQFIQEGSKVLFETTLFVNKPNKEVIIKEDKDDFDRLNYLKGKSLSFINEKAFIGTVKAHSEVGGVPNIILNIDELNAFELGYMFYFFMKACAVSAGLLGVNPFNQPGVEVYKKNMFKLLGKK